MIIGTQMASTVTGSCQSRMVDITTAGAASVTPRENARPMRNRKLASDRVRTSKRRSRYSYAVYTLARWKKGTTVSDRRIIASGRPKYSWTNRRPVAYACPVVPTIVTALICVAMTDRPTAHHGSERFARKYPSTLSVPFERRRPSETIHTMYTTTTSQSSLRMGSGERAAEQPERDDDRRLEDHD